MIEKDLEVVSHGMMDLGHVQLKFYVLSDGRRVVDEESLRRFREYLEKDRKSTRLNSSHIPLSRMPSSA